MNVNELKAEKQRILEYIAQAKDDLKIINKAIAAIETVEKMMSGDDEVATAAQVEQTEPDTKQGE